MEFHITLTGTAPLLMHNSQLADPLSTAARSLKRLTGKRLKTEDDHMEIARLEHFGSLYFDDVVGPYVPGENITRCLIDAAAMTKRRKKVISGMFISTDVNPLAYRGPRDPDGLWDDENFRYTHSVKIGQARTMRTRPCFREWRVAAEGILDTNQLELSELEDIATTAGLLIGLGDWRPRFGRFSATVERVKAVAA